MGAAAAEYIEELAALVTEGRSYEPFELFLGCVAGLLGEHFGVETVGDAVGPVREAANRHLTGAADEVAFNRFTEDLSGLVAVRLGSGSGDDEAAVAVWDLCNLAAGGYLGPEDGQPVRSADPGLDGWVAA
jgi:hypothetical protein